MLKPIEKQSVSDAVFEQLKQEILIGTFGPGAPLPSERKLCEMLGVNRAAIREALKRLEQARLVSIHHGGGTRVSDFMRTAGLDLLTALLFKDEGRIDTGVARSIIEMRSALAPEIVQRCAERATPAVKQELGEVVDRMAALDDLSERQRLAMEFWNLTVEGSDNVAYRLCYNTLQKGYSKFFDLLTNVLADELNDVAAYRAIADAVERGEPKTARREAQTLINKGGAVMLAIISNVDGGDE